MSSDDNALVSPGENTPASIVGRNLATPGSGQLAALRAGGYGQEEAGGRFNANELLRIIQRRKWLILGILTGSLLLSLLVTLAMTPLYLATTTLEVNPGTSDATGRGSEVQSETPDTEQFLRTQYGLLASRALAERVVQTLNLDKAADFASGNTPAARRESATSRVAGNLQVLPIPGSSLIQLSFSDTDAGRSARIVNAIANGFIDTNLERRYNATGRARQFLQTRLAAIRLKLEASERQLVRYAQNQGIVELGGEGGKGDSLSAQSLTSINEALSQATAERIAAEQRYRQAARSGTTQQVLNSATVQALRSQRAELQAEYEQKLVTFKPDLPEMVALKSRIDSLGRNLRVESGDVTSSLRSAFNEAAARESQLRGQVGALRGNVLDLRGRGIQYNILTRDVDTNRALYDALLQRYKEIGVAGGVGESQASIVDKALRPGAPYQPNTLLNLLIGLVTGLVLGLGAAFSIEFVDDTIKTPEDVLSKLQMPVLGAIPKAPKSSSVALELDDQRTPVAEAYFSVMTALQFSSATGMPRTMIVSSSRAAEGKTSTSLALSRFLAKAGASVLLIDADMRKPSFKTDTSDGRGLSKLLTTAEPVLDHVVPTFAENLSLLPGGTIPPNPAELLSRGRMAAIIEEAKQSFDLVVIDAPPVLGLADSPLMSSLCDATIMVVEAGIQRRAALNALQRLVQSNARIAGIVLTKFDAKTSGYGYGYGYGYGERYGEEKGRTHALVDMTT